MKWPGVAEIFGVSKRRAEKRSAFRHLWLHCHRAHPPSLAPHPMGASLFFNAKNVDTFRQCLTTAATAFRETRTSPDTANVTSGTGERP